MPVEGIQDAAHYVFFSLPLCLVSGGFPFLACTAASAHQSVRQSHHFRRRLAFSFLRTQDENK